MPPPGSEGASPPDPEMAWIDQVGEEYLEVDEEVLDTEVGDEEENLVMKDLLRRAAVRPVHAEGRAA